MPLSLVSYNLLSPSIQVTCEHRLQRTQPEQDVKTAWFNLLGDRQCEPSASIIYYLQKIRAPICPF